MHRSAVDSQHPLMLMPDNVFQLRGIYASEEDALDAVDRVRREGVKPERVLVIDARDLALKRRLGYGVRRAGTEAVLVVLVGIGVGAIAGLALGLTLSALGILLPGDSRVGELAIMAIGGALLGLACAAYRGLRLLDLELEPDGNGAARPSAYAVMVAKPGRAETGTAFESDQPTRGTRCSGGRDEGK